MPLQAALLWNTTFEFQILPRANRKCFLLVHCQTMDAKSYLIVPRQLFLIMNSELNFESESGNDKKTMYFVFVT